MVKRMYVMPTSKLKVLGVNTSNKKPATPIEIPNEVLEIICVKPKKVPCFDLGTIFITRVLIQMLLIPPTNVINSTVSKAKEKVGTMLNSM